MLKNFIKTVQFNLRAIEKGHHKVTYNGIKAIRSPFDYLIYQMILFKIKPDLVIEIGTNVGGGALYIADILNIIGKGFLHTIDIKNQSDDSLKKHNRIKCFTEGWENYDLKEAENYKKVLVIEDSTHTFENTLAVMKKFAPVVTKDSYLIIEDGIIDRLGMKHEFHGGPLKAINDFLKTNDDFIIDRQWCDFFGKNATFNVNGYLLKVV